MLGNPYQKGFTLIESMLVLSIIALLLSIGLPSFNGFMERNRLRAAVEGLSVDLHWARSEAVMRGPSGTMNVNFVTNGSNAWCYGFTTDTDCDCRITDVADSDACVVAVSETDVLKRMLSTEYQGDVRMTSVTFASNTAGFTAVRGLSNTGQVVLAANDNTVSVQLTALGRIRVCSDSPLGYPAC